MKKRLIFLIITLLLIISLTSCNKGLKERTEGDFKYVIKSNDKSYITGFSDTGKEKKSLYMPETLGGKQVYGFGYYHKNKIGPAYNYYDDFDGKVKKLYFNENTWNQINCGYRFRSPGNLKSVLLVFENIIDINEIYVSWDESQYCCISYESFINSGNVRMWNRGWSSLFKKDNEYTYTGYHMQIGNINFLYNYENSPYNGIYHFDSVDNDIVDYIPADPIREGYKFIGWYKEKECINPWDFNNDKCGDLIYAKDIDDIDNYEYSGMNLYAKWEKE